MSVANGDVAVSTTLCKVKREAISIKHLLCKCQLLISPWIEITPVIYGLWSDMLCYGHLSPLHREARSVSALEQVTWITLYSHVCIRHRRSMWIWITPEHLLCVGVSLWGAAPSLLSSWSRAVRMIEINHCCVPATPARGDVTRGRSPAPKDQWRQTPRCLWSLLEGQCDWKTWWGSEQPDQDEDVPAHARGLDRMSLKVTSNPSYSVIQWPKDSVVSLMQILVWTWIPLHSMTYLGCVSKIY